MRLIFGLLISVSCCLTAPSLAAESLFRTAAKVCVREADTIDGIANGRLVLSAKIEALRAEIKGLRIKKNKQHYNKIQAEISDLLYESNASSNKYQLAVGIFQKACSKKTMTFDVYELACKGKLENKFCMAFKAHHKKLSTMDNDIGMPPRIN